MIDVNVHQLADFPEVRIGHLGSLLVTVWRGSVTAESVQRVSAVEEELLSKESRITTLSIVLDSCTGQPDPALIRAGADAAKRFDPKSTGAAIVILAGRSTMATTRVVVQGLLILVGESDRYRIFERIDLATAWIWKLPGQDPGLLRNGVVDAVRRFVEQSRTA